MEGQGRSLGLPGALAMAVACTPPPGGPEPPPASPPLPRAQPASCPCPRGVGSSGSVPAVAQPPAGHDGHRDSELRAMSAPPPGRTSKGFHLLSMCPDGEAGTHPTASRFQGPPRGFWGGGVSCDSGGSVLCWTPHAQREVVSKPSARGACVLG